MKATRHLNHVIQFSYPFFNVKSPEFRSWFQTEGRNIPETCWISLEQQRRYNSQLVEGWTYTAEVKKRCREYYEIAEVKQNKPGYISDVNWYTQLKTEERIEIVRLAEVEKAAKAAVAARSEEAVAPRPGTGMSQYIPLVLAIPGDP